MAHPEGYLSILHCHITVLHVASVYVAQTRHRRLGHSSNVVLSHLNFVYKLQCKPSDACHGAKHQRSSFNKSEFCPSIVFELILIDLWGPYKQPTSNGWHCFFFLFTIVDDFSRPICLMAKLKCLLLFKKIKNKKTSYFVIIRSI